MCARVQTLCFSCIVIYRSVTIHALCVFPIGFPNHSLGLCQFCKQKTLQIADSKIMFVFMAPLVQVISMSIALITMVLKQCFSYTPHLQSLYSAQKVCFILGMMLKMQS